MTTHPGDEKFPDFDLPELEGDDADPLFDPFPDPEIPSFDGEQLMVPPWVKFPNLPYGSLGWRMGIGEGYMDEFLTWFKGCDDEVRDKLKSKYQGPGQWSNFFDIHETG